MGMEIIHIEIRRREESPRVWSLTVSMYLTWYFGFGS